MKIGRIVSDTTKAFEQALWFCRVFGLDWKEYILPFNKNGMLAGYYVLDETKSTVIAKIKIEAVHEV